MCLAEVESIFSDATTIWENMQLFLDFEDALSKSKKITIQTVANAMSKLTCDTNALEHHYFRACPENRPLEMLQKDLEEKDKLITTFAERLDTWKTKVDEYKAKTMKVLIDDENF